MDGDFAEKLKKVLSDPEAMSKITAIASGLGASQPSDGNTAEPPQTSQTSQASQTSQNDVPLTPPPSLPPSGQTDGLPALIQNMNTSSDPRLLLLSSLKPLLREEKRERIDAITRALALASMMKNFRK